MTSTCLEPRCADASVEVATNCGLLVGAALRVGNAGEAIRLACQCGYLAGVRGEMLDATMYPLAAAALSELARGD